MAIRERERQQKPLAQPRAEVTQGEIAQILRLLQKPETRGQGIERLSDATEDTNAFADAMFRFFERSPRGFKSELSTLRNDLSLAPDENRQTAAAILRRLAHAGRHIDALIKAEKAYLALSSGGKWCANADAVRERTLAAAESGKPLNVAVLWDPAFFAKGSGPVTRDALFSLMQLLDRANCPVSIQLIFNDIGHQPNARDPAFDELRHFVEEKADPQISLVRASTLVPGAAQMRPGSKGVATQEQLFKLARNGLLETLAHNSAAPVIVASAASALITPGHLPAVFLQPKAISATDAEELIRGGVQLIQGRTAQMRGVNVMLNIMVLHPEIFRKAWFSAATDHDARLDIMDFVQDMLGDSQKTPRERAAAASVLARLRRCEEAPLRIEKTHGGERAEQIYAALASKRFRGARPLGRDALKARIREAVESGSPLVLTVLWGGYKESRSGRADQMDLDALVRLREWADSLDCRTELKIIFCDTHAYAFNWKMRSASILYRESLKEMIGSNGLGMEFLPLSGLYKGWRAKGLDPLINRLRADAISQNQDLSPLVEPALKHSDFMRKGRKTEAQVVEAYARMRHAEDLMLDREFPGSVSVSIGGSPSREAIFAARPTLFFAPFKALNDPPWFLDAGAGVAVVQVAAGGTGSGHLSLIETAPAIAYAPDRDFLSAEKLLRRVSYDVSANPELFNSEETIARMRKACEILEQKFTPMKRHQVFGAAILYVRGDAVMKTLLKEAAAALKKEKPDEPRKAADIASAAILKRLKRISPGKIARLSGMKEELSEIMAEPDIAQVSPKKVFGMLGIRKELEEVLSGARKPGDIPYESFGVLGDLAVKAGAAVARRLRGIDAGGQFHAESLKAMRELIAEAGKPALGDCMAAAGERNLLAELLLLRGESPSVLNYYKVFGPK